MGGPKRRSLRGGSRRSRRADRTPAIAVADRTPERGKSSTGNAAYAKRKADVRAQRASSPRTPSARSAVGNQKPRRDLEGASDAAAASQLRLTPRSWRRLIVLPRAAVVSRPTTQDRSNLINVVPAAETSIVANYKETTHAGKAGPPSISPSTVSRPNLHGRVERIARRSGFRILVAAADNATGNFTKVVPAYPSRIQLDTPAAAGAPLPNVPVVHQIISRPTAARRGRMAEK